MFETSDKAREAIQKIVGESFYRLWSPPPKLTMSEWAEEFRVLSAGTTAQPGKWITATAPHTEAIMNDISSSDVEEVVFMGPSQIASKTEILLNAIGFFIHQEPSPILLVQPRVEDAKSFSKDRLQRMVDDCPELRSLVSESKSRDSANTIQHKHFPGGDIYLAGANAPAGLAMRPRRVVLYDEVDRYPPSAGDEGDPVTIARARTRTYHNRKLVQVSSPTTAGTSRIHRAYLLGTRCRWLAVCPDCGEEQLLSFDDVQWPGRDREDEEQRPAEASIACRECGSVWDEGKRRTAVRSGRWKAEFPERRVRSYWLTGVDSARTSMAALAEAYIASKGNTDQEKAFLNTQLAYLYEQPGEAPDVSRLYERRESYPIGKVPDGGLILTGAADIQGDRIEVEIKAWGRGTESWSIEHRVLTGPIMGDEIWTEFDKVLDGTWYNAAGGAFGLSRLAVDSGAYTDRVYTWAERRRGDARVYIVKGMSTDIGTAIGRPSRPKVDRRGRVVRSSVQVWPIGTGYCKSAIYARLRLKKPEPGEPGPRYMHFPQYDEEWFHQLAAEKLVISSDAKGFPRREWHKTRARNEALDLQVYNFAMMMSLGLETMAEEWWEEQGRMGPANEPAVAPGVGGQTREDKPAQPRQRINPYTGKPRGRWF